MAGDSDGGGGANVAGRANGLSRTANIAMFRQLSEPKLNIGPFTGNVVAMFNVLKYPIGKVGRNVAHCECLPVAGRTRRRVRSWRTRGK